MRTAPLLEDLLRLQQGGSRLSGVPLLVAKAGWKVFVKPFVRAVVAVAAREHDLTGPGPWEMRRDMVLDQYEPDTVTVSSHAICSGMTVLDIGAHIGYFTRKFAQWAGPTGRVFAFEPHPVNYRFLTKNVSRWPNVTPVQTIISDTAGVGTLHVSGKSGCHSLFETMYVRSGEGAHQVPMTTLDGFWMSAGQPEIGFMKIDIEGAELRALRGATDLIESHDTLRMVVEFCPAHLQAGGTDPSDVLEFLTSHDFHWSAIGPQGQLLAKIPDMRVGQYANLYCEKKPTPH